MAAHDTCNLSVQPMLKNRHLLQSGRIFPIVVVLVALAALAAGIWLSASLTPPEPPELQSGSLLQPPKSLPAFQLQDQHGKAVTPQSLQGQWTLVFFGYTHCPDVCPNTLAVLNLTLQALPEQARAHTNVMLVSVDPQRDTQAQLGQYVAYFNPKFIGARGPAEELNTLTGAVGVLYVHNKPDLNGDYTVDHSAAVLLLDPQARWSALFSKQPLNPETLANDIQAIQHYYEEQQ